MPGKIRLFCVEPSDPAPAVMRLEISGTNVPITDNCSGLQQFFDLLVERPAFDGEISGASCSGVAPNGKGDCQVALNAPVDVHPMQTGRVEMGGVSLISQHTGPYVIRFDSAMGFNFDGAGGQIVLHRYAPNQKGVIFQPRTELPQDANGPCITQSRFSIPNIAAAASSVTDNRPAGQGCVVFDHSIAPIGMSEFKMIEPLGGDFGVVVHANGQGFAGNEIDVLGAHGQRYACLDIGHGTACGANYGGNTIRAIVAPGPGYNGLPGTGVDYWGHDDIMDLQIHPGDDGIGTRGITLEAGSYGLQCRIGRNAATTPILMGASGHPRPNVINGISYAS